MLASDQEKTAAVMHRRKHIAIVPLFVVAFLLTGPAAAVQLCASAMHGRTAAGADEFLFGRILQHRLSGRRSGQPEQYPRLQYVRTDCRAEPFSVAGKVSGQGMGEPTGDVRPDALHGLQRSDVGKVHLGEMRQGDDLRSQ